MSPLDRKLLRTLWQMKGQAAAIALVIATGVTLLVMQTGLVLTLTETREAYYQRYRLADAFAPVARAPRHMLDRLEALPGVTAVEGRVTGGAQLTLEAGGAPVRALAISLPDRGRPRVNDVFMTAGRLLDPDRPSEVLVLDGFATAHGLKAGDRLSATMNGARRSFEIVGFAQSPEFIYTTAPGELVPDDRRFAVLWMSEAAMAAAFDMDGAFNEALLALGRDASVPFVLDAADRLLDPFGGLGAYGLADHASDRFVSEEIRGLKTTSAAVPPIFLGVAAFLLYIVIARMVQSEREQIGILKAFGYTDIEIGMHYFKLVLVIALAGAALGAVAGVMSGRALSGLYQTYYKFPFLIFRADPAAIVTGFAVSMLAALAGSFMVLRGLVRLSPAVAMRPPAPADYSRTGAFSPIVSRFLDQPSRMVLRRLIRQPGRMLTAVIGISAGMALSVAMLSVAAGFNRTVDLTFSVIDRSDALVSFVHPLSDRTVNDLRRMEGVLDAEPTRAVAVTLRFGRKEHRTAINAFADAARLNRALGPDLQPIDLSTGGIVLSRALAGVLGVSAGDTVTAEVQEGSRPVLRLPVTGVSETLLGSPAFMSIDALNRALKEPGRVSGVYLAIAPEFRQSLYIEISDMPQVAGVAMKGDSREAMQRVMDQGAGQMRFIMMAIAAIITFGIVYNSARIAFAERARDLASLRVIGFTRGEAAFVLLGELALVTLAALPLGAWLGYHLSFAISAGFSTDLYQVPTVHSPEGYGTAALAVLLAALVSGALVKRDVNRVDMVAALKVRE